MGRSQVRYNQARRGRGRIGLAQNRPHPKVSSHPPPQPRESWEEPDSEMQVDDAQVLLHQMSHPHRHVLKKEGGFLSTPHNSSLIDPKLLRDTLDKLPPHQLWRIGKDVADTFAYTPTPTPTDIPKQFTTREFTTPRSHIPNALSSLSEGTEHAAPYETDPNPLDTPSSHGQTYNKETQENVDDWLEQALQSNDDADLDWLDRAIL